MVLGCRRNWLPVPNPVIRGAPLRPCDRFITFLIRCSVGPTGVATDISAVGKSAGGRIHQQLFDDSRMMKFDRERKVKMSSCDIHTSGAWSQ